MYMQDQPMNALNYREEIHFGWLRGRGGAGDTSELHVSGNKLFFQLINFVS